MVVIVSYCGNHIVFPSSPVESWRDWVRANCPSAQSKKYPIQRSTINPLGSGDYSSSSHYSTVRFPLNRNSDDRRLDKKLYVVTRFGTCPVACKNGNVFSESVVSWTSKGFSISIGNLLTIFGCRFDAALFTLFCFICLHVNLVHQVLSLHCQWPWTDKQPHADAVV